MAQTSTTKKKKTTGKSAGKKNTSARSSGKNTAKNRSGASRSNSTRAGSQKKTSGRRTADAIQHEPVDYALFYEVFLWIILGIAVLLFISLLGLGGFVGESMRHFFFGCFGLMAYPFPFVVFFLCAFSIANKGNHSAHVKSLGVILLFVDLCCIFQLIMLGSDTSGSAMAYFEVSALYRSGGGLVGGSIMGFFANAIGTAGAVIVALLLLMISVILITQRSVMKGMSRSGSHMLRRAKENHRKRSDWLAMQSQLRQEQAAISAQDSDESDYDSDELSESLQVLPKPTRRQRVVRGVSPDTRLQRPEAISSFQSLGQMPVISEPEEEPMLTIPEEPASMSVIRKGIKPGKKRSSKAEPEVLSTPLPEFLFQDPAAEEISPMASEDVPSEVPFLEDTDDGELPEQEVTPSRSGRSRSKTATPAATPLDPDLFKDLSASCEAGEYETRLELSIEPDEEEMKRINAKADEMAGAANHPNGENGSAPKKVRKTQDEIDRDVEEVAHEIETNEAEETPVYVPPAVTLLKLPSGGKGKTPTEELQETAQKLQTVFDTFNVKVRITNVTCGPSVTRYELMPEMGVKVSKIVSLQDDIKLNLAASDIRIEAPIPGKAAVGIEVPNRKPTGVLLRELLEAPQFAEHKSNLAYAVGKDIAGNIIVSDIAKMPHLLIAGATGSGKSVFINTLIMSILYKAKPDEVKLIMIDPKVVELSVYNGIPHLMIPVVTDPRKAAGALNWGVAEMMKRYEKFAGAGVRDLKGYNAHIDRLGDDIPEEQKPEKLPQIIIIVDELADLMMVASNDVEDAICRLAQLARAAGIHLVIATQRPSVDVITGIIKANMPSRIAFSVSSGVDSRTIIDQVGAEKLLGNGDMLFAPQTFKQPLRVQGAYVSDEEVQAVVDFLKENNGGEKYSDNLQSMMEKVEKAAGGADGGGDCDELFADAAKLIVDKDKASIGMLQRYFKIGFNRAARIMDQLSEAGVVGPEEGTKPRRVLMSGEQLENYLEQN